MDKENSIEKLNTNTSEIINNAMEEEDVDKVKEYIKLFNVDIAKKNMFRINKLYELIDKAGIQIEKRLNDVPDELTVKELLDCLNTMQNQIEKTSKSMDSLNDVQQIQLTQQNTVNVTVTPDELSRESREKVLDFINQVLNSTKKVDTISEKGDIIDIEPEETSLLNDEESSNDGNINI